MQRISKKDLARNLGRAIRHEVGMEGLNTLIFGWLKHRKYGRKYYNAVRNRNFLFISEIQDLSEYAGYDLST